MKFVSQTFESGKMAQQGFSEGSALKNGWTSGVSFSIRNQFVADFLYYEWKF